MVCVLVVLVLAVVGSQVLVVVLWSLSLVRELAIRRRVIVLVGVMKLDRGGLVVVDLWGAVRGVLHGLWVLSATCIRLADTCVP